MLSVGKRRGGWSEATLRDGRHLAEEQRGDPRGAGKLTAFHALHGANELFGGGVAVDVARGTLLGAGDDFIRVLAHAADDDEQRWQMDDEGTNEVGAVE